MIHLILLGPLAVVGGGLLGLAHERFRRKRLTEQLAPEPTRGAPQSSPSEQGAQVVASDDLVELKYSQRAAHVALGLSAAGLFFYPPLGLISLPIIGYSAYNWIHARYPAEREWHWAKAPSTVLAIGALTASMLTGYWVIAPLVLTADLAARKRWASGQYEELHAKFVERARNVVRMMLQGERRWEWMPILLARVSMGLFFAISGWNKLFQVANWNGLVAGMVATGLPYPEFLSAFLASVEFYGGSLLTIGFMSTFWAIALAFAMIVAIVTVEIPMVIPPGLGPLDWLDWFLYLPQVMYVLIFLWLIIRGPGPHSVDAVIARQLGFDKDADSTGKAQDDTVVATYEKDPEPVGTAPQPA
jgi:putative oxidoreductase